MAARYWVGGTNTWNATVGSKWSATPGPGTPGASVPTTNDDVFIDSFTTSGQTVTMATGMACKSLTTTGFAGTLAFSTFTLTIGLTGSSYTIFTLGASTQTTSSSNGGITFSAGSNTRAVFLNGNTFNGKINCNSAGAITFSDNGTISSAVATGALINTATQITVSGALVVNGTLTTGAGTALTKTLVLNGTLSCTTYDASPTNAGMAWSGNGTFTITGACTFSGQSNQAVNVATVISNTASFTLTCLGTNVFKSLTWNPQADTGANLNVTGGALTVTNAFTVNGRIAGQNIITGTGLSAGSAALSYVTFGGGAYTGAATWSGTGVGVWSGVTGVTASAPKTIYWVGGAAAMMDGTTNHFSASSGGSSGERFPLFGDTLVFDANSGAGAVTTTTSYYISSLTFASPSVTYAPASLSLHQGLVQSTGSQFTITTAAGDNFSGTAAGGNVPTIKNIKIVGNLYGYWTLTGPVTCGRVLLTTTGQLSLGSSTLTIDGGGTGNGCVAPNSGSCTIDVGTGTLIIDSTKPTFSVGGLTVLNCKYDLGVIQFNKSQTGANNSTSSYGIYWFNGGIGGSVVLVGGVAGTTRVMGGASSGAGNTISVNIDGIAGAGVLDKNAKFICTTVSDGFHAASFTSLNSTNTSAALHCALTGNVAFTGAVAIDYCDVTTSVASGTIPAYTVNGSLTTTTNWNLALTRNTAGDAVGGTDVATRVKRINRSSTDIANGTDSATRSFRLARSITDAAKGTDAVSRIIRFARLITETVGGTDSVSRTFSVGRFISDASGGTDFVTRSFRLARSISDSVGGTDAINKFIRFARAITDIAGGTDSVNNTFSINRNISDAAGGTDSVTWTFNIVRSISDSVGGTDSVDQNLNFMRYVTDFAGGTDFVSNTSNVNRNISDFAGGTDSLATSTSLFRAINDAAGGTDSTTQNLVFVRYVVDSAPAVDQAMLTLPSQVGCVVIQVWTSGCTIEVFTSESTISVLPASSNITVVAC